MPFKILILHPSLPSECQSLSEIGSTCFAKPLNIFKEHIQCIAHGGRYDLYFCNNGINHEDGNYLATVSLSQDIAGLIAVSMNTPSPTELRNQLDDLCARSRPTMPIDSAPFVPDWTKSTMNGCYERPPTTTTVDDSKLSLALMKDTDVLSNASGRDFAAMAMPPQSLLCFVYNVLLEFKDSLWLDEECLKRFLLHVLVNYRSNSYHNFCHGVDVFQTVWFLLKSMQDDFPTSDLERFSILIAALAHDIGHFGFKDKYVIESEHPLALIYNDRSPIENFHCLVLFSILQDRNCWFGVHWDGSMKRKFRRIVSSLILATDMAHHFDYLAQFRVCTISTNNSDDDGKTGAGGCCSCNPYFTLIPSDERLLTMILLIKASDLCNVIRPFPIAEQWGCCLQTEFYHQGDWERYLGIDCPIYDDRHKDNFARSQVSFLENVALPLYDILVSRFSSLSILRSSLLSNLDEWRKRV